METPDAPAGGTHRAVARRHPRRRKLLWGLVIVLVVGLLALGGFGWWLASSLNNARRVDLSILAERPVDHKANSDFLLLGVDSGTERYKNSGTSILDDVEKKTWPTGKNRSDANMLVHVDADGEHVYVISIPRDTYLPIYDGAGNEHGSFKVNNALSEYSPSGAVTTIEKFTGVHVDHLAIVDFDRFEKIIDAVGGIYLQDANGVTKKYDGEAALDYSRERKALIGGDLDRIKRQQNVLRAIGKEVLGSDVFTDPVEFKRTMDAVTSNLAVDHEWSNREIRGFALSMRNIKMDDVSFLTIPTLGSRIDPVAGDVVVADEVACAELFTAVREDRMAEWVQAHPEALLGEDVR